MSTAGQTRKLLIDILELARYAPSVHNAQPWRVRLEGSQLTVSLDEDFKLAHSDATGRETIISLGIFCEALAISAQVAGRKIADINLVPEGARVVLGDSRVPTAAEKSLALAMKTRCTDRSVYQPADVAQPIIREIESSISLPGVKIQVSTDPAVREKTAELTAKGIGMALSSPDFRRELSRFLVLPWSGRRRGISVLSLHLPLPLAVLEPLSIRLGWGLRTEVRIEKKRWQSASAIIFITTDGDLEKDWFAAGRAYLRAALAAEQAGLAQATSAATVEASTYHEDIESLLATRQRLQAVIRLGKGSAKRRYSPRLKVHELMTTSTR